MNAQQRRCARRHQAREDRRWDKLDKTIDRCVDQLGKALQTLEHHIILGLRPDQVPQDSFLALIAAQESAGRTATGRVPTDPEIQQFPRKM